MLQSLLANVFVVLLLLTVASLLCLLLLADVKRLPMLLTKAKLLSLLLTGGL